MRMPPTREQCNAGPISRDQCFLFGTGPTFDLPLCGNRISDPVEMLRIDQTDGPAPRRKTCEMAFVVFGDATFEIGARGPDVISAVRTVQNVQAGAAHGPSPSFETRPAGAPQDEEGE